MLKKHWIWGFLGGKSPYDNTQDIFGMAFFNPSFMMGKARHYGLHTDSSHRFERGVDPSWQAKSVGPVDFEIAGEVGNRSWLNIFYQSDQQ
ncbi:MAG: hypothetical protein H0A75_04390 [Candidatus Methanofishera endochildressiae]|uniref:B3/B4 tRNA-binding domain-containing protein n=1 Tax=Candidatus Methanofishera endochildressiae TaxID=2738884 RepID=A0A7Z0SDN7_9GAMM|nr:hypothetical protein [Candidatus Methanofishera endochildressiae]